MRTFDPNSGLRTECKLIHCIHPLLLWPKFNALCGCKYVFCMLAKMKASYCGVVRPTS